MHRSLHQAKLAPLLHPVRAEEGKRSALRQHNVHVRLPPALIPILIFIIRRRRLNNPPNIASHDFFGALLPVATQCANNRTLCLLPLFHPLSTTPLHPKTLLSEPTALLRLRLALHLLRNLDVDLEELADAAVQAHGLALVQVGFAVLGGDALFGAGVDEPIVGKHVSSEVLLGA
jgi:hypothetical protein